MLRIDLDAAGIPYTVEGPDGPLYADFHALRHSYIAMLDRSGATLKEAMQLARHSDPKLTMAVYGRAQLHDLAGAVGRLPGLLGGPEAEAPQLAATGTDSELPTSEVSSLRTACASGETLCERLSGIESQTAKGEGEGGNDKPLAVQGVESDCEPLSAVEGTAPCRTRTYNPLIKSHVFQWENSGLFEVSGVKSGDGDK
jgi:hypothetical protein